MIVVSYFTVYHRSVRCSRIVEKLFYLMASDITENTAVFILLKKPVRTGRGIQAVRAHSKYLNNPANGSLLNQFSGIYGAFHLQTLTVADHIFFPGFPDGSLHHFQLFQGGKRRFVHKVILSGLHDTHAQRRAL